jgi:peptidoglycan-N-acetylglucosamine deacetylase
MRRYLRFAILACRHAGVTPSFLLHPLDVLGPEDAPQLSFFPGMDVPGPRKRAYVKEALRVLGEQYVLVTMGAHAAQALAQEHLAVHTPSIRSPTQAGLSAEA